MKRLVLLVYMAATMVAAQTLEVKFTAVASDGDYHPFDQVLVQSRTRGWSQVLDYPDTTLFLDTQNAGIESNTNHVSTLSKPSPNPFSGKCETLLSLASPTPVTVQVYRADGKVALHRDLTLSQGTHSLAVELSQAGVAFLSVSTPEMRHVAKIVSLGGSGGDNLGVTLVSSAVPDRKAYNSGVFQLNDILSYTALWYHADTIVYSTMKTQPQKTDALIVLEFVSTDLTVVTGAIDSLGADYARCIGRVAIDGGSSIVKRGICWASHREPTLDDNVVESQGGLGQFLCEIEGLAAGNVYHYRAFAINATDTAYGNVRHIVTPAGGFNAIGASNNLFSIGNGFFVRFSIGNLQYSASGSHAVATGGTLSGTWRFAANQADCIGSANSNIAPNYNGYIDLFAWGTSGWSGGTENYHPYDRSVDDSLYYINGDPDNEMIGPYRFADWGIFNAISNGGNQAGLWRTLLMREWWEVLYYRSTYTNLTNVSNPRYVKATVGDMQGVILFPDTYFHPEGVPEPVSVNTRDIYYTDNIYPLEQWVLMEAAGCVFIPAAGYRSNVLIYQVGVQGRYASANRGKEGYDKYSYHWGFGEDWFSTFAFKRHLGYSVRLVQDYNLAIGSLPQALICDTTFTTGWSAINLKYTVSDDGELPISMRGICWDTLPNPTLDGEHIANTPDTGWTWVCLQGLQPNTAYHIRAYAANPLGVAYSPEVVVYTQECHSFDSLGSLASLFSVAPDHRVHFSKGNLQFTPTRSHATASGESQRGHFRFANVQTDYVGEDFGDHYRHGMFDLFGYGTSGWNSGATAYLPNDTSTAAADYYVAADSTASLTGSNSYADWGVFNAITNGGNRAGLWRTLSAAEWQYLLFYRPTASNLEGIVNPRYVKATVGEVQGLIVFPDSYEHPDSIAVPEGINDDTYYFDDNFFTSLEFEELENRGCLFLPASGWRVGTAITYPNDYGSYWTSDNTDDPVSLLFYDRYISLTPAYRHYGRAVRLVRDE